MAAPTSRPGSPPSSPSGGRSGTAAEPVGRNSRRRIAPIARPAAYWRITLTLIRPTSDRPDRVIQRLLGLVGVLGCLVAGVDRRRDPLLLVGERREVVLLELRPLRHRGEIVADARLVVGDAVDLGLGMLDGPGGARSRCPRLEDLGDPGGKRRIDRAGGGPSRQLGQVAVDEPDGLAPRASSITCTLPRSPFGTTARSRTWVSVSLTMSWPDAVQPARRGCSMMTVRPSSAPTSTK